MIKLTNVSKNFKLHKALDDITLELEQGQIIALLGENGAGKSTLMKCIFGFYPLTNGTITLDGEPITYKNLARLSFATCEHSFFPNLTAKDHKEFYQMQFPNFNEKRFDALMEFFQLPYKKKLKTFSTGQKNQIETILALSQGADYIFMDEPFSGSDIFNRDDFYKVLLGIVEPHETIILSTHLIDEVKNFIGRAILLKQGTVIGDITWEELEETNLDLVSWIKEQYHHSSTRVLDALKSSKL